MWPMSPLTLQLANSSEPFCAVHVHEPETLHLKIQAMFRDSPNHFFFVFFFFESDLLCLWAMPYVTHDHLPRKNWKEHWPEMKVKIRPACTTEAVQASSPHPSAKAA
jgi:hypothetical protein